MASPLELLRVRRGRAVWRDPLRKILTLESFSRTEADGGRDIGNVIDRVVDPELRQHLRRHADDELRHAELFRHRAWQLRQEHGLGEAHESGPAEAAEDLARLRSSSDLDAHGYFTSGMFDELGEVAYVAMLNVAEERAAELFQRHHSLTADDPDTQAVFAQILRDERFHVGYTAAILKRWGAEGRESEIRRARAATRGNRLWNAWKRIGLRSGAGLSRLVLRLVYLTLLSPFGLMARRSKERSGWHSPAGGAEGADALRSPH